MMINKVLGQPVKILGWGLLLVTVILHFVIVSWLSTFTVALASAIYLIVIAAVVGLIVFPITKAQENFITGWSYVLSILIWGYIVMLLFAEFLPQIPAAIGV